ncbi:ribosome maturation factor RimM [Luteimonas sp. MHLX1A]|uniref:ribosome maturation factor RimM n=1 Tax=Alterluteimonas muca TaxID=2878684 RepID=UPI001E37F030|nr:ribosome maturation factor RimM [Luteimonas sp. MHLX1A]MCD9046280.1 ribosome maturation factor RimM [Luteimonas sp. MHLX1A]
MTDPTRRILLGRIHGAFGVRGELRVESFTDPETELFRYQPWTLRDAQGRERVVEGARGRPGPKGVVATLPGVEDREGADAMRGTEIWVPRSALPPPSADEFYWVDLEGMRVRNVEGVDFGTVAFVFSTGANDVLVVRDDARERMVPFVRPDYVRGIDMDAGTILVDWDPDF